MYIAIQPPVTPNPKIPFMKRKCVFGDDKIPCKGKVIIRHLDYARRILTAIRFKEEEQLNAASEQAQTIEVAIIEIATLCSGSRYWQQLHDYLDESGIEVSEEFICRMTYLDRIMDVNPAEAKRN